MNNKDLSRFYPDNLEGSSDFVRREEINELVSTIKTLSDQVTALQNQMSLLNAAQLLDVS